MKTAKELLDERLSVQNGFHKGATVTISRKTIEQLMEDYHVQFEQQMPNNEKIEEEINTLHIKIKKFGETEFKKDAIWLRDKLNKR